MAFASFTISQAFLGAPLQFYPPLGSQELEELIDAFVTGSAAKQDKFSEVTIDFYNNATVDLNTGALVRTYNVFPLSNASPWALDQSPTQSQTSGFSPAIYTPSPGSSAAALGDSGYGSFNSQTPPVRTASAGRVAKKAKKESKSATEMRLPGFSIMTKDGVDVTNSAGRGTKTKEQREHAHLMRIMKACDACKKKKIRCDPSHRRPQTDMSRTSTSNSASTATTHPSTGSGTTSNRPSPPSNSLAMPTFANAIDDFVLFPEDVSAWNTDFFIADDYDLSQFSFDINDFSGFEQLSPAHQNNTSFSQPVSSSDQGLGHIPELQDLRDLDEWIYPQTWDLGSNWRSRSAGASPGNSSQSGLQAQLESQPQSCGNGVDQLPRDPQQQQQHRLVAWLDDRASLPSVSSYQPHTNALSGEDSQLSSSRSLSDSSSFSSSLDSYYNLSIKPSISPSREPNIATNAQTTEKSTSLFESGLQANLPHAAAESPGSASVRSSPRLEASDGLEFSRVRRAQTGKTITLSPTESPRPHPSSQAILLISAEGNRSGAVAKEKLSAAEGNSSRAVATEKLYAAEGNRSGAVAKAELSAAAESTSRFERQPLDYHNTYGGVNAIASAAGSKILLEERQSSRQLQVLDTNIDATEYSSRSIHLLLPVLLFFLLALPGLLWTPLSNTNHSNNTNSTTRQFFTLAPTVHDGSNPFTEQIKRFSTPWAILCAQAALPLLVASLTATIRRNNNSSKYQDWYRPVGSLIAALIPNSNSNSNSNSGSGSSSRSNGFSTGRRSGIDPSTHSTTTISFGIQRIERSSNRT